MHAPTAVIFAMNVRSILGSFLLYPIDREPNLISICRPIPVQRQWYRPKIPTIPLKIPEQFFSDKIDWDYLDQFFHGRSEYVKNGYWRWITDILFEIRPIDKRRINGSAEIRCRQYQNVCVSTQLVQLCENGVYNAQWITRFTRRNWVTSIGDRFNFID